MIRHLILFVAAISLLCSCEKEEEALVLPPPTGASHASVNLEHTGSIYSKQVFFDFETGVPVYASDPASWDLAFESTPQGRHIFINNGQDLYVANTHVQDMRQVTSIPASLGPGKKGWKYDAPCGLPDGTAIGQWYSGNGESKGDVYIVWTPAAYWKLRVLSASDSGYAIEWAPLESTGIPATVHLAKDANYNYIYFSFSTGMVKPDPPKHTWDVVFTRYRPLVYDANTKTDVPYPSVGVLLNPYKTQAAADSTTAFSEISLQKASTMALSNCRDVIGYDWKSFSLASGYTVNRAKNYVLHTRKDHRYKLHFLSYYNSSGVPGNPMFEYLRLQ